MPAPGEKKQPRQSTDKDTCLSSSSLQLFEGPYDDPAPVKIFCDHSMITNHARDHGCDHSLSHDHKKGRRDVCLIGVITPVITPFPSVMV